MKSKEFKLPKEVVAVQFIPRKRGMAASVGKGHIISGGMLDDTIRKFCAPLQRNGKIANVLTAEEKEFLEKELGGMDLSVYGDFWKDFYVTLRKNKASNMFDMSDPIDYIAVKVLEKNTQAIAKSWGKRDDKQTYQFAITREGEVSDEDKAKFDIKKEAFKLYGKIEDDKDKLIAVLRLLSNRPVSSDSKLDWIQKQVDSFVDSESQAFVNVVNDAAFETKKLINEAVDVGYVLKRGNKYTTKDGLSLAEVDEVSTFNTAVRYLDNPKNQEVRDIMVAKVEELK